jgi:nucleoside diphosphate kinase
MERTLIILKPDAVQRGLCGEIITASSARAFRSSA